MGHVACSEPGRVKVHDPHLPLGPVDCPSNQRLLRSGSDGRNC